MAVRAVIRKQVSLERPPRRKGRHLAGTQALLKEGRELLGRLWVCLAGYPWHEVGGKVLKQLCKLLAVALAQVMTCRREKGQEDSPGHGHGLLVAKHGKPLPSGVG